VLIVGGNQSAAGGYNVDNSLRFNSGSSDYLQWNSSPSGNRQKFTYSVWFKRSSVGNTQILASASFSGSDEGYLFLSGGGALGWQSTNGGDGNISTTRLFKDFSAWYHLVWSVDTTQATASNRMKFYINGVQETSFSTETYPNQNQSLYWNVGGTYYPYIGRRAGGDYFNGYMAEVVHINNQQLDPTSFGEFDEDSSIWKPIDVSGLTFGTTGYYLPFENSAALGQDDSGNGNNFTVNNLTSIDQSTDTCTNNFATWNRLIPPTFTNHNLLDGNLTVEGETSSQNTAFSTIAVSSGKWFCEMKLTVEGNATSSVPNFGIASTADFRHADSEAYYETSGTNIYAGRVNSAQINRNGSDSGTDLSSTPDVGDIIGLALDLDSGTKTLKFYLNGSLVGTVNINTDEYCFICAVKEDDNKATVQGNFGGTNTYTVSSGNSDGNGYGNFEYSVPSGYYALNTKNLAEYG